MPLKARMDTPRALHHFACQGIEGSSILRDDNDKKRFIDRLAKVLVETATPCFVWL